MNTVFDAAAQQKGPLRGPDGAALLLVLVLLLVVGKDLSGAAAGSSTCRF